MDIVISEIIQDSYSIKEETCWLKCRLADDSGFVAFWGELDGNNRNIVAVRHQKSPLQITLLEPEYCVPTSREKREFGVVISVPSGVQIILNPES